MFLPAKSTKLLSVRATCETSLLNFHVKAMCLAGRCGEKMLAQSCRHSTGWVSPCAWWAGEGWLSSALGWDRSLQLPGPRDSHHQGGIMVTCAGCRGSPWSLAMGGHCPLPIKAGGHQMCLEVAQERGQHCVTVEHSWVGERPTKIPKKHPCSTQEHRSLPPMENKPQQQ